MKTHISATINESIATELKRVSRQECRSVSKLIEVARVSYLNERTTLDDIPTSEGVSRGTFNRAEAYA